MKKTFALFICLLLVFTLISCDYLNDTVNSNVEPVEKDEQDEKENGDESTDIQYLHKNCAGFKLSDDCTYYILEWFGSLNYICDETEFIIPSTYEGLPVKAIAENAFDGSHANELTSITIPTSIVSIGECAFSCCENLESITIPSSVTNIGECPFVGCDQLTSILVDKDNQFYESIDGNLYTKGGETLIQYAYGKSDTHFTVPNSVTHIEDGAFGDGDNLESVTIGKNVTSIAIYPYDFYGFTSLTFENTDGWYRTDDIDATSGREIDVSNPYTNVEKIKDTYGHDTYYWKRNP